MIFSSPVLVIRAQLKTAAKNDEEPRDDEFRWVERKLLEPGQVKCPDGIAFVRKNGFQDLDTFYRLATEEKLMVTTVKGEEDPTEPKVPRFESIYVSRLPFDRKKLKWEIENDPWREPKSNTVTRVVTSTPVKDSKNQDHDKGMFAKIASPEDFMNEVLPPPIKKKLRSAVCKFSDVSTKNNDGENSTPEISNKLLVTVVFDVELELIMLPTNLPVFERNRILVRLFLARNRLSGRFFVEDNTNSKGNKDKNKCCFIYYAVEKGENQKMHELFEKGKPKKSGRPKVKPDFRVIEIDEI